MARKLIAALLLATSFPTLAAFPCSIGDWGRTYVVSVQEACGEATYAISCGGIFGNSVIGIQRLTPVLMDCYLA